MAWYNATIDIGHAVGAGAAILPTVLTQTLGVAALALYRSFRHLRPPEERN
jgi:hypothetical protein